MTRHVDWLKPTIAIGYIEMYISGDIFMTFKRHQFFQEKLHLAQNFPYVTFAWLNIADHALETWVYIFIFFFFSE